MMIKNPYRITEHVGVNETIPTAKGNMTGLDWCKAEAERLRSAGIPAKAVKRNDVCYVVRNKGGCEISKEDEDLVGADALAAVLP